MSFMSHVRRELEFYQKLNPEVDPKILVAVKAACKVFSDEEHSGMSAGMSSMLFRWALSKCGYDDLRCLDRELKEVAGGKDAAYEGELYPATMNLFKELAKHDLSKGEVDAFVLLFTKLVRYLPLTPLTGEDSEWNALDDREGNFQNNRCSAVFKKGDRAYYLDAIVFRSQDKVAFTGNVASVDSAQYIRRFPFEPKTFYVDIIEKAVGDSFKDINQLKPVADYYEVPSEHFGEEVLREIM